MKMGIFLSAALSKPSNYSGAIMIKFNKSGQPPTPGDIAALETKIGHKLPQNFIDFIRDPEAGVVYPNIYHIVPVDHLAQAEGTLRDFEPFSRLKEGFIYTSKNYAAPALLPFAFDSCGNHICLCVDEAREDYGAVYFLDHEFDNSYSLIGKSFEEFLTNIKPPNPTELDISLINTADVAITREGLALIDQQKKKIKKL